MIAAKRLKVYETKKQLFGLTAHWQSIDSRVYLQGGSVVDGGCVNIRRTAVFFLPHLSDLEVATLVTHPQHYPHFLEFI